MVKIFTIEAPRNREYTDEEIREKYGMTRKRFDQWAERIGHRHELALQRAQRKTRKEVPFADDRILRIVFTY